MLNFVIGCDGRIEPCTLTVLQASHPAFVAPAEQAALAQRFTPAVRDGVPVLQLTQQRFNFEARTLQVGGS